MTTRPTSVTVICWLLGVLAVINFFTAPVHWHAESAVKQSSLPIILQYAGIFAVLVVNLVCAFNMLKGKNWARWLYVCLISVNIIIGFAASTMKYAFAVPALIVYCIIFFVLFRHKSNEFFAGTKDQ